MPSSRWIIWLSQKNQRYVIPSELVPGVVVVVDVVVDGVVVEDTVTEKTELCTLMKTDYVEYFLCRFHLQSETLKVQKHTWTSHVERKDILLRFIKRILICIHFQSQNVHISVSKLAIYSFSWSRRNKISRVCVCVCVCVQVYSWWQILKMRPENRIPWINVIRIAWCLSLSVFLENYQTTFYFF